MLIKGPLCAGFPIGVSYPHFYQADPALIEAVDGSYPEKEKHESYFYIEPVSSTTLLLYTQFSANFKEDAWTQTKILKVHALYPIIFYIIIYFVKTHFN